MLKQIKNLIISILKFFGNLFFGFLFLGVIYLVVAVVLTYIPANMFSSQPEEGVVVYLKSNGVHTDIVLPIENKFYSWHERIHVADFAPDTVDQKWVAFGWGDKGFYLETPNWSDLKVTTAFNAMFLPTPTAMHVTLYSKIWESERTRKLILTDAQYLLLCEYVFKSFLRNRNDNFILINCCHYNGLNDNFYEAVGSYNALNTCNNWTNKGLKQIGVKTAMWAPFDKCILYHFKEKQ